MIQTDNHLAELVAKAASDKKAGDIVIMDLTGISPVTDYFVICSAHSITQVQAIADNMEEQLRDQGIRLLRREGYRDARWVLLDYGNCVAHIFLEEDRQFYKLERLWGDAKQVVYQG